MQLGEVFKNILIKNIEIFNLKILDLIAKNVNQMIFFLLFKEIIQMANIIYMMQ